MSNGLVVSKVFAAVAAAACLWPCLASCRMPVNDPGGGTQHISPQRLLPGETMTLSLRCSAITGGARTRFKDVVCIYAIDGEQQKTTAMSPVPGGDERHVVYEVDILVPPAAQCMTYHFECIFDGEKVSRWFPPLEASENPGT